MIKTLTIILIIILFMTQGCVSKTAEVVTSENNFSSSQDTLIIKTEKRRGAGLFALGVSEGYFMNITDSFPYPITLPKNIREVQRTYLLTDFDATNKYYVDIIQGKLNEDRVIIIDENNNKNLEDDSIRVFRSINWESEENLIKVKYNIQKQQAIVEDSTWLRIGVPRDEDDLWLGHVEHLIGEFLVDSNLYQIGIIATSSGGFNYPTFQDQDPLLTEIAPSVALISQNSIKKDTLGERDILERGEIIKLDKHYYRYERISNFGDSLLLVKENNFHELIGTQLGMIAPEFTGVTASGDTIESKSLHDRALVIVNSCGCGGDVQSTEAYFDIAEEFGDKIHVIRLDDGIKTPTEGLQLDRNNNFNKDLYRKYRKAFCSRTCYTIDTNKRVIDKFPISEWEQYLPKLVYFKN